METDLERDLRAALSARAQSTAEPASLADRIMSATQRTPSHEPQSRRTGYARIWIPVGAMAVILVVVLSTAWVRSQHDAPLRNGPIRPASTAQSNPAPKSHRELATGYVERLLARTVLPPGSVPTDHAPVASLAHASSTPGLTNLVERHAWWTAPGTVASAVTYLKAHLPAGLTLSSTDVDNNGPFRALGFGDRPGVGGDAFTSAGLAISVDVNGNGIALRADAQAGWRPERTAAETVPSNATSVDATFIELGGSVARQTTLTGSELGGVAALVNEQPTYNFVACAGLASRQYDLQLVFHAPGRPDIHMNPKTGGCGPVQVTVGGQNQPSLTDGVGVYVAVAKAMGLPPNYGISPPR